MPHKSKKAVRAYQRAYRAKNRERRRKHAREYIRAKRRGEFTCPVCTKRRESVRVRVCDCNRHLLDAFRLPPSRS